MGTTSGSKSNFLLMSKALYLCRWLFLLTALSGIVSTATASVPRLIFLEEFGATW